MNIEKEKQRIIKKNKKIEEKEKRKNDKLNRNLPAEDPKGIKKWFRKVRIKLGLGVGVLAGLFSVSKIIESSNQNSIDNNTRSESDMEENDKKSTEKLDKLINDAGIKNMNPDLTIEQESEDKIPTEQKTELKDQLEKQIVSEQEASKKMETPKRENGDISYVDKAKENVGLDKSQDSVNISVETTVINDSKKADEITAEKSTNQVTTNDKENITTQFTIEQENKKEDVNISIDGEDNKVYIEDGTIVVEGEADNIVSDINKEEETTTEVKHEIFDEVKNPFEDIESIDDDMER